MTGIHTAGRLADTLKQNKAELVQSAYLNADEKTTLSDISRSVDSVLDRFDTLDPRLDAKVAIQRVTHHYAEGFGLYDATLTAATLAALVGGLYAFRDYEVSTALGIGVGHPAVLPMLAVLPFFGLNPRRGASIQTAAQAVLQTAEELTGVSDKKPTTQALAADHASAMRN